MRNNYAEKQARLGRHTYDKESKSFQQGAWKNLNREETRCNQRALQGLAPVRAEEPDPLFDMVEPWSEDQ